MKQYIKSMKGIIQRQRGYGSNGFELAVTIAFDAIQFNKIKKAKQCPLAAGMAQIKNVVLDACGARGMPSYASQSYTQRFPRAKNGLVTLTVYFDISAYQMETLGLGPSKALGFTTQWIYHAIDLNTTLEATRADGHLFAKTALASHFGN
jgi:hypothetical protein